MLYEKVIKKLNLKQLLELKAEVLRNVDMIEAEINLKLLAEHKESDK